MKPLQKSAALNLQGTINTLKTALSKAWDVQTRAFLLNLLEEAQLLGADGRPSQAEISRIHEQATEYLGVGLREAAREPVIKAQNASYMIGRKAVSGIDYSFTRKDINALDLLRDDMLFWVGKAYDRNFSGWMQKRVREYFDEGLSRVQLTERIVEQMAVINPSMKDYIALLADHNTTRVAEMGHVSGYEDAGIEYAEIVAVMDARTSPICRHLHGRIIPVSAMSAQKNRLLAASKSHSIDAAKKAQPMLSATSGIGLDVLNTTKTGQIIEQGVGFPPYHFRCRTTTVAHFEPAEYHARAREWAVNGEIPKKAERTLIDYAMNSKWGTHKLVLNGNTKPAALYHLQRHGKDMGLSSLKDYNSKLMEIVRSGKSERWLTIRDKIQKPYPVLYARDPKSKLVAIMNLKGQTIASFYEMNDKNWDALIKHINEDGACVQLRGGLTKWIECIPK